MELRGLGALVAVVGMGLVVAGGCNPATPAVTKTRAALTASITISVRSATRTASHARE